MANSYVAMSVIDTKDEWFKKQWAHYFGAMAWKEAKTNLERVMWIESIQDEMGERICKEMV